MTGILALVLVTASATSTESGRVQVIEHYAIAVPAGYVLKDVSPKLMDFDLYALADQRTGSVKCTLYVGNHPAFPKFRWSGRPTESGRSGGTRKEFRSPDRVEGLMNFSGVTYKNTPGSPFETIHYFADHLSAHEMKVVTAVLDTIRIAKPHLE